MVMKISQPLALAFIAAAPAFAQTAPAAAPAATAPTPSVIPGALIFTGDGHKVGQIDRVQASAGTVSVIYGGHFIKIPVASLTANGRGFVTSLTKSDLAKL